MIANETNSNGRFTETSLLQNRDGRSKPATFLQDPEKTTLGTPKGTVLF